MILGCEEPRVYTKPKRELTPDTTHGFACIAFAENVLGVTLFPWQRWLLIHALELDGNTDMYRYRYIICSVGRQNGKTMLMLILALWHIYALDSPTVIGTAQDSRIRALAGQMPNIGSKSVIFRDAQPNFRRIYKYMAGITVDSDMDAAIPVMDAALQHAGDHLAVPYLLVGGDLDELTPPDHIDSWIARLTCPKELWLYQDVFHPMGEVVGEAYPAIADWLLDAVNGAIPDDLDRIVTIDPRA